MAVYKGSAGDGQRISALEKLRAEKREAFEQRKKAMEDESKHGLKSMEDLFQSNDTSAEKLFKQSTVGLVSAEEYKRKQQLVEQAKERHEKKLVKAKKKRKTERDQARKQALKALSFSGNVDEEDEADEETAPAPLKKVKKDPNVPTHHLPDRDREQEEQRLRLALQEEWKEQQERIKAEAIEVTYSYWDGSGHRRSIEVTKGTRIDQFLETCRRELSESFHELRGVSSENLMYIKEDLIIPHHFSFYDLIVTKARGKSGPLFHFDVHDDVRLTGDASVEKDESHAGKIVTRGWYERNKHIFPASRWEVYDPAVQRTNYTIHGHEVNAKK